jgi:hypothetical protein
MKVKTGIAVGMLAMQLGAGCYPHDCKPNDPTCLPCNDPQTQNPACAPNWEPIPVEAKPNDGGSAK